jgi:hypothetical protein
MIDEGFRLSGPLGNAEYTLELRSNDLQMRLFIEGGIE